MIDCVLKLVLLLLSIFQFYVLGHSLYLMHKMTKEDSKFWKMQDRAMEDLLKQLNEGTIKTDETKNTNQK